MKYISETFKYFKSNLAILPAIIVAAIAFATMFDYNAFANVTASYSGGYLSSSYTAWLLFFLPVNTESWITIILSILGYLLLIADLSFIQSMVDKHVRFGTKSFRSVMSSFTVNLTYGLMLIVLFAVISSITAFIFAAVMKTFSMFSTPYIFICGISVCAVICLAELFALCHFALWLPCLEVTGFKVLEALSYSYSLARPVRWKIFLSVIIPIIVIGAAWCILALTGYAWVARVVASAICACAFIFVSTACYLIYVDKEGIEREDLKKF